MSSTSTEPASPGSHSTGAAGLPRFSIIVPTRNRPELLRRALQSIAAQSFAHFEVIVVDDASGPAGVAGLRALARELGERFVVVERSGEEARHGPHASRNAGIARARAQWIAFLDDDDYYCDSRHLEHADRCLTQRPEIDLYVSNQVAMRGEHTEVPTWLPYAQRVAPNRPRIDGLDCSELRHADLLQPEGIGFGHVNMCVIRRELAQRIGGFWEIACEEDLDFFLRVVDQARVIAYRSATVSVNTLREGGAPAGVSTLSKEESMLRRVLAVQHTEMHCARSDVRRYARLLHAGVLKTLAKRHYRERKLALAASFAARAATVDPSLRWLLIALALNLRAAAHWCLDRVMRR